MAGGPAKPPRSAAGGAPRRSAARREGGLLPAAPAAAAGRPAAARSTAAARAAARAARRRGRHGRRHAARGRLPRGAAARAARSSAAEPGPPASEDDSTGRSTIDGPSRRLGRDRVPARCCGPRVHLSAQLEGQQPRIPLVAQRRLVLAKLLDEEGAARGQRLAKRDRLAMPPRLQRIDRRVDARERDARRCRRP